MHPGSESEFLLHPESESQIPNPDPQHCFSSNSSLFRPQLCIFAKYSDKTTIPTIPCIDLNALIKIKKSQTSHILYITQKLCIGIRKYVKLFLSPRLYIYLVAFTTLWSPFIILLDKKKFFFSYDLNCPSPGPPETHSIWRPIYTLCLISQRKAKPVLCFLITSSHPHVRYVHLDFTSKWRHGTSSVLTWS